MSERVKDNWLTAKDTDGTLVNSPELQGLDYVLEKLATYFLSARTLIPDVNIVCLKKYR